MHEARTQHISLQEANLEAPTVLRNSEVVVPLEVLSLLLLGRCFYQTPKLKKVWRAEVELFLEALLYPGFRFGSNLHELKDAHFYKKLEWAVHHSRLKHYGLYGQALVDKAKVSSLKGLKAASVVRNPNTPYSGATSLAASVAPLLTGGPSCEGDTANAKLYSTNQEAIEVGEVLNKLCRLAREGVPESLRSFEKERDAQGVIWQCFESVYSRASVKVERSLLKAMLDCFRQRPAGLDYILFQPLYQIVYARDKSLAQLQPSVGLWLMLFGQQGSETCYSVHKASEWIERDHDLRCYFLGKEWPFFLRHVDKIATHGKYPGVYLFYKEEGQFAVGENSFHPANIPAQAFVLGEEIRNLPDWAFPTLKSRHRGRAWNTLVKPNPITKTSPKAAKGSDRLRPFFKLGWTLKVNAYRWTDDVAASLTEAVERWSEDKDKEYLFSQDNWKTAIETAAASLEKGRQVPLRLQAPLVPSTKQEAKRKTWNQGSREQKATDSVLNTLAQAGLYDVHERLGGLFSNYLPGLYPLGALAELPKTLREIKGEYGLFNLDVAKAFDSIDLLREQTKWDLWLERCDEIVKRLAGEDTARALRNIFLPFVERVRFGFYANDEVKPGKTPLGLSLGPSFWLYLSLPLAATLHDMKNSGACLWATMSGDDTLAVLKPHLDEQSKAKLNTVLQDFAELGFSYHHFKNFQLDYDAANVVKNEGPFVDVWPKTVPITYAKLTVYKHLIYITKEPEKISLRDLHTQAKLNKLYFPTNLLRFFRHYSKENETLNEGNQPSNSNYEQEPINRETFTFAFTLNRDSQDSSLLANDRTSYQLDTSQSELAKKEYIRLVIESPTTHGGLLHLNKTKLLPPLKNSCPSWDNEEKRNLRASAAKEYSSLTKGRVSNDCSGVYREMKKKVIAGFPDLAVKYHQDVQSGFGDAEAVLIQTLIKGKPVRLKSSYAAKMKQAMIRAKAGDFTARMCRKRGISAPLALLAMEHPDLMLSARQKQMAEPGTLLGPRFSLYFDVDDHDFKRSKQALNILGKKEGRFIASSPNAELYSALSLLLDRKPSVQDIGLTDDRLGEKVIDLFGELGPVTQDWFRGLIKEHIKRAKKLDKTLQGDLERALGCPEGGYVLVYRAWQNSSVVQAILNA